MANAKIRGIQIDDTVAGAGLTKDVSENLQVNVDGSSIEIDTDTVKVKDGGITNDMLAGSITDAKLVEDYIKTSEVDNSTIEFDSVLKVKSGGITNSHISGSAEISIAKLNTSGADFDDSGLLRADVIDPDHVNVTGGSDGQALAYKTGGFWQYIDVIQQTGIVTEEIPSGSINGANVTFTIANTPVTGTVRVYINGLRQEEGSGKDYTISGTTITFDTAPETGDVLFVDYFK